MKKEDRNIRVRVESEKGRSGFHIYLDFSGQREYLMYHRHNGLLYNRLKGDGVRLSDLRRWKPFADHCCKKEEKDRFDKLWNMTQYLLAVIDDYLQERKEAA